MVDLGFVLLFNIVVGIFVVSVNTIDSGFVIVVGIFVVSVNTVD